MRVSSDVLAFTLAQLAQFHCPTDWYNRRHIWAEMDCLIYHLAVTTLEFDQLFKIVLVFSFIVIGAHVAAFHRDATPYSHTGASMLSDFFPENTGSPSSAPLTFSALFTTYV